MTAFNTVRFNLKPGREQEFLDAHQKAERNWPGLRHANLIRTGDQSYCIIGEWDDMDSLAAARPFMLATLDTFRDTLEGDTDPASGPHVLDQGRDVGCAHFEPLNTAERQKLSGQPRSSLRGGQSIGRIPSQLLVLDPL